MTGILDDAATDIDEKFGEGFAMRHPDFLGACMITYQLGTIAGVLEAAIGGGLGSIAFAIGEFNEEKKCGNMIHQAQAVEEVAGALNKIANNMPERDEFNEPGEKIASAISSICAISNGGNGLVAIAQSIEELAAAVRKATKD